MDTLVESLMEELNCETVFKIPIFGGIPVYESVVVTWIIMLAVLVLCVLLVKNLSIENPSRKQLVLETAVSVQSVKTVLHTYRILHRWLFI